MASPLGDWAWKEWIKAHPEKGGDPIWNAKEWTHLTSIMRDTGPRFKATWLSYLQETHPFYEGHPPSLLRSNISRFLTAAMPEKFALLGDVDPNGDVTAEFSEAVKRNRELQEAETRRRLHSEQMNGIRESMQKHLENKPEPSDQQYTKNLGVMLDMLKKGK